MNIVADIIIIFILLLLLLYILYLMCSWRDNIKLVHLFNKVPVVVATAAVLQMSGMHLYTPEISDGRTQELWQSLVMGRLVNSH